MSTTLTPSRTVGDRRRRRLAVSGDAPSGEPSSQEAPFGSTTLRARLAELPSASPWLPIAGWRQLVILLVFWTGLAVVGAILYQPLWLPSAVAPCIAPLTIGPAPKLLVFMEIGLWLLAAELAALVGWYRSHSQLDFSGRYRVWGWISVALAGGGLLSGTGLHLLIAQAYGDQAFWLNWKRETVVWLAPLCAAGLLTGWLADRDLRRCASSLWTLRLAMVCGLAWAAGRLMAVELECHAWYMPAMLSVRWITLGLLVTALWRQACYVTYVCADPPERATSIASRFLKGIYGFLGRRWFRTVKIEEAPPKRTRRKKKEDEETAEEEVATPPKRRRKTTATSKTKRAPRPRKAKTDSEAEFNSLENSSETEESYEESGSDSWESSQEYEQETPEQLDDELAELEALTRPDPAPAKSSGNRGANQSSAKYTRTEPEESDDSDDQPGGIDQAHSRNEMKGLSKRERRELKKQQRAREME